MKAIHTVTAAIFLTGVLSAAAADYTQNFDSMGINGTTAPPGWSMGVLPGDSPSATFPTSPEMASTTNGSSTLIIWNQTDFAAEWNNQMANEGGSPTSLNRMLGTSPSGSRGSVIQFSLNNTFGTSIASIKVSYDMQTVAAGTLRSGFSPGAPDELPGYSFYFLDGSTWTHVSSLDRTTSGTASGSIGFSSAVPNGGTMQFRWFDDNANAYSPDTMYAIDNISITIPEPTTLSLLALGALAAVTFRRKA